MGRRRTEKLLSIELDGELDKARRAKLERALERDAGAAAARSRFERLSRSLERLPVVEARTGFAGRTIARIRGASTQVQPWERWIQLGRWDRGQFPG